MKPFLTIAALLSTVVASPLLLAGDARGDIIAFQHDTNGNMETFQLEEAFPGGILPGNVPSVLLSRIHYTVHDQNFAGCCGAETTWLRQAAAAPVVNENMPNWDGDILITTNAGANTVRIRGFNGPGNQVETLRHPGGRQLRARGLLANGYQIGPVAGPGGAPQPGCFDRAVLGAFQRICTQTLGRGGFGRARWAGHGRGQWDSGMAHLFISGPGGGVITRYQFILTGAHTAPTLSTWGMLSFAALLLGVGGLVQFRSLRRQAATG